MSFETITQKVLEGSKEVLDNVIGELKTHPIRTVFIIIVVVQLVKYIKNNLK